MHLRCFPLYDDYICVMNNVAVIAEITCPPLPEIRDGSIQPTLCTDGEVPFGTICQLSCLRGYKLRGPRAKQCTPDGTWSADSREPNQCLGDLTLPSC